MTMHEYSIVAALLERVEDEVLARRASRVVKLHVRLGELSGVEPELLVTAFDTFRERTVCDGAPMQIDRVKAEWACDRCGGRVTGKLRCRTCDRPAKLVAGDEIILSRIELEVPDV